MMLFFCKNLKINLKNKQNKTKDFSQKIILSNLLFFLFTPQSFASSNTEWKSNMHQMSYYLYELLTFAHSPSLYNTAKNDEKIKKDLMSFQSLAQKTHNKSLSPDKDPGVNFLAKTFNDDISLAINEFNSGQKKQSFDRIKTLSHYCFSCHTRTNKGIEFQNTVSANFDKMHVLEKAQFFAATRQYEKSLNEFDHALIKQNLGLKYPIQWEEGLKKSLAIAIRVRRNPDLALELISRLFDKKTIPDYLKSKVYLWRIDVNEWSKQKLVKKSNSEKISFAENIVQKSKNTSDKYFIQQLRASTYLHDVLDNLDKSDPLYAKTLFLTGELTKNLAELSYEGFANQYFSSCAWNYSKTVWAKKCFKNLESYYNDKFKVLPENVKNYLDVFKTKIQ